MEIREKLHRHIALHLEGLEGSPDAEPVPIMFTVAGLRELLALLSQPAQEPVGWQASYLWHGSGEGTKTVWHGHAWPTEEDAEKQCGRDCKPRPVYAAPQDAGEREVKEFVTECARESYKDSDLKSRSEWIVRPAQAIQAGRKT